MTELALIRKKLSKQDKETIAQATGYRLATVRAILAGKRNDRRKVIETAEKIIKAREDFIRQSGSV